MLTKYGWLDLLEEVLIKSFPTWGFPSFGNIVIDEIGKSCLIPQSERENVTRGIILGHLEKLLMKYTAIGLQNQVDGQVRLILKERKQVKERERIRISCDEVPLLVEFQSPEKRLEFFDQQEIAYKRRIAFLHQREEQIYLQAQKRFPWVLTPKSNTYTDANGDAALISQETPKIALMKFSLPLIPIIGFDGYTWVFTGDKRWRDSQYSKILKRAANGFYSFSERGTMFGGRYYVHKSVRLKEENGKFTWVYTCRPSQFYNLYTLHGAVVDADLKSLREIFGSRLDRIISKILSVPKIPVYCHECNADITNIGGFVIERSDGGISPKHSAVYCRDDHNGITEPLNGNYESGLTALRSQRYPPLKLQLAVITGKLKNYGRIVNS